MTESQQKAFEDWFGNKLLTYEPQGYTKESLEWTWQAATEWFAGELVKGVAVMAAHKVFVREEWQGYTKNPYAAEEIIKAAIERVKNNEL